MARPVAEPEHRPIASLRPIAPERFGHDESRHLLWRAGFGGPPEQVQTLVEWGPERAVDHLLDFDGVVYERPGADTFDGAIMRQQTAAERAEYQRALRARDEETIARLQALRQQAEAKDRRQIRDMQRWWLARMIETPKPLEERMTLFWHGHFATGYRAIENSYHMFQQNELFRRFAAGDYGELLGRIIRDPAMLAYLDNNRSRAESPNENLARELMELFSLGVGAYTEKDIKEGARALTGYSFEGNEFVFRGEWHDAGQKTILGARGALDGEGFVRAILEHKACAEFMAAKLYRYFVADLPDNPREAAPSAGAAVTRLASAMRAARYQMKPVLRTLFLSEHFYDPAHRSALIKSPVQLVVGAARSLGAPVRDLGVLSDALDLMGQNLFFPPSVAGWPGGRTWVNTSTLFVRQNILTFLLTGRTPSGFRAAEGKDRYNPAPLLDALRAVDPAAPAEVERVCEHLLWITLGPPLGRSSWRGGDRMGALVEFARAHGGRVTPDLLLGLLAIITAMPEYQLC